MHIIITASISSWKHCAHYILKNISESATFWIRSSKRATCNIISHFSNTNNFFISIFKNFWHHQFSKRITVSMPVFHVSTSTSLFLLPDIYSYFLPWLHYIYSWPFNFQLDDIVCNLLLHGLKHQVTLLTNGI